ncbi:uncharacterized protein [Pagrus major]|uniref:uncharacterized protein n=1 Tax=Pagrus major TaxID=143350 RepID=UPI003CC89B10
MFSLNRAALLQLLVMCQVFAGHFIEHKDILVSRGESVMLTCNTSEEKIIQINWTKDRFRFAHLISTNETFSNFSSHRVTIDLNLPAQLNVSNAQHEDAGLYICEVVSGDHGTWTTEWNLTVSEAPERVSSSWDFLYILTSVIGLLLCVIAPAVCLCRKLWKETPNQDSVRSRTLSYVQFHVQLGGQVSTQVSPQVAPPQYQSCVVYRMNHQQREEEAQFSVWSDKNDIQIKVE